MTVSPTTTLPAASRRRGTLWALPRTLRQSPVAVAALAVIVLWILVAFLAPLLAPYPPLKQDVMQR
ncbi:MAG TPA: hypothetical protein VFU81_22055, partial [Thermomicrobiales bacterium]|nr:hypothetical protein [Thermomicrobiales bacterium]